MAFGATPLHAVIFDYGGVLTTPGREAIAAWTHAERIRPETFSATLKEWLSRSAPAGTPIHRLETGELTAEEFNQVLAARLRTEDDGPVDPEGLLGRLFSYMQIDAEMLELVQGLRERGLRTALLSNSWGNNYPWERIRGLFEFAVISSEVGLRKPDSRIYRRTLDKLGLAPEQTVFVDDGAPNIEVAEQLGMHTILHRTAEQTRSRLTDLIPADTAEDSR